MQEEQWNLAVRRFLKRFGIRAQRELDEARQRALGNATPELPWESLEISAVLRCPALELEMELKDQLTQD